MVDGFEIDFAVLVGDAAVDVIESVVRSVGRNGEGDLHFFIEGRHRGSVDMQAAAEIEAGPARELREGGLIERRELERSALVERAFRNDQAGVAGAGDGAAAGANGGGAVGGDELAAGEAGSRLVRRGDGDGEDVVDGGGHLAGDGAIVEGGQGEDNTVGLVDDQNRSTRREGIGRGADSNVAVLIGHAKDERIRIEIGRSDGLGGEGNRRNRDGAAEHISKAGSGESVRGGRLKRGLREDGKSGVALGKDKADRYGRADSLPCLCERDARRGDGLGFEGVRSGDVDFGSERDANGTVGGRNRGGFDLADQGDVRRCGLSGGDLRSSCSRQSGVESNRCSGQIRDEHGSGQVHRARETRDDVVASGIGERNEGQTGGLHQCGDRAGTGRNRAGNETGRRSELIKDIVATMDDSGKTRHRLRNEVRSVDLGQANDNEIGRACDALNLR